MIRILSGIILILCFLARGESYAQCADCTVTVDGDNALSGPIINGSVVCVSGSRTLDLNLESMSGVTICIFSESLVTGNIINMANPITINNFGILGTGSIAQNIILGAGSTFNNQGLFFGSLTANGAAGINNTGSINGNVSITGAGTIFGNTGMMYGDFSIGSGSIVNNDGALTIQTLILSTGGTLNNREDASISVATNTTLNGSLNNDGFINFTNIVTLANTRILNNNGNISALNFTNSGTVNSQDGTINIGRDFTNNASGVYNIESGSVGRNLINSGSINIHNSLNVTNTIDNRSGATISAGSSTQPSYLSAGGTITNNGCFNGLNQTLFVNKFPINFPSCSNGEVYFGGNPSCPHIIDVLQSEEGGYQYFSKVYIFSCNTNWSVPGLEDGEEPFGEASQILIIGGGGGGGRGNSAGGGGAGEIRFIPDTTLTTGTIISINIGEGGAGSGSFNSRGSSGTNTSFGPNITSLGGGGGGSNANASNADQRNGMSGGSGGGGAYEITAGQGGISGPGQGEKKAGAPGRIYQTTQGQTQLTMHLGAGGGGAMGPGEVGTNSGNQGRGVSRGGDGGAGYPDPFLGNNIVYAGGGGGTSIFAQGQSFPGKGGSDVGGSGNVTGIGFNGITAGSGGGAGRDGGGKGAKGLVMVTQTFRILPVKFIHFSSDFIMGSRRSKLSWSTSKEWENSHFEIERSIDGTKTFTKIGEVPGMGWTDEISEYSYDDDKLPLSGGNIFYRLKQIDFNGRYDYSDITAVRVPNVHFTKGVWRAYPNPSEGEGFHLDLVDISQYQDEPIILRVLSSTLSTNEIKCKNLQELNNSASSIMANAPVGLWIFEIQWGNKVERIKVVKK